MRSKVEHDFDPQVLLYFGCYIPSTSTFFRRRLIERGLLLDCDYRVAMDFEFFARLARLGCSFHYVPRFIAAFRWHEDNVSLRNVERRSTRAAPGAAGRVRLRAAGVATGDAPLLGTSATPVPQSDDAATSPARFAFGNAPASTRNG